MKIAMFTTIESYKAYWNGRIKAIERQIEMDKAEYERFITSGYKTWNTQVGGTVEGQAKWLQDVIKADERKLKRTINEYQKGLRG